MVYFKLAAVAILARTALADPVIGTARVFCFRITDIRCVPPAQGYNSNKFNIEFEILNWSDAGAGGLEVSIAQPSSPGITFHVDPTFNGVDTDGRPLILETFDEVEGFLEDTSTLFKNGLLDAGEDLNANKRLDNDPMPGNVNKLNEWSLDSKSNTKLVWKAGPNGSPIPFRNILQTANSFDKDICLPQGPSANAAGNALVDTSVLPFFPFTVTPTEVIDDGNNVLDGFVITVDGLDVGKTLHLNWFLTGADNAILPESEGLPDSICFDSDNDPVGVGQPIGVSGLGNQFGFGAIGLKRIAIGTASSQNDGTFVGNSGFNQTSLEFFDSVYNVPADGKACPATEFVMEPGPNLTATFLNGEDNTLGAIVNAVVKNDIASVGGDPHFNTFDGTFFSYHGECDLLLMSSDAFASSAGLHVHIRTTRAIGSPVDYSYISDVAVRIGENTLEVSNDGKCTLNGTPIFEQDNDVFVSLSDYVVERTIKGARKRIITYNIALDQGRQIEIRANQKTHMMFVDVEGDDFDDAVGLLAHSGGRLLGRDKVTNFEDDWNSYGEEWQIGKGDDPILFYGGRFPQFPEACQYTVAKGSRQLRAVDQEVNMAQADEACSNANEKKKKACVFDVMATGDVDTAKDSFYL